VQKALSIHYRPSAAVMFKDKKAEQVLALVLWIARPLPALLHTPNADAGSGRVSFMRYSF